MAYKIRKTWYKEAMLKAIEAVKKEEMGTLKASQNFNVPRSTLRDYLKVKLKVREGVQHLLKSFSGCSSPRAPT
jgi:ribosomal protein L19